MEDASENEDENTPPVKISLAESNQQDRDNFTDAVYQTQMKADVIESSTGQELMDELKDPYTVLPDMIFMDQHMDLDNGKDALKEIKKDDDLKDIPTFIYTDSTSEKDIEKAYNSGADMYVEKPIFFRNLVRILRMIFTMQWRRFFTKPSRENFVVNEVQLNNEHGKSKGDSKSVSQPYDSRD